MGRGLLLFFFLVSCGRPQDAESSAFAVLPAAPGPTPFVSFVPVHAKGFNGGGIQVTVRPRPQSSAAPLIARYSFAALQRRGLLSADEILVPVYGLYAGAQNVIDIEVTFADGSTAKTSAEIVTPPYDPDGWVYGTPQITQLDPAGAPLGFSFYLLKSPSGPPVIMDTDGQVRWVATGVSNSTAARFTHGGIVVGDTGAPVLRRLELDGTSSVIPLAQNGWTDFHHDIAEGKTGLLVAVDVVRGGRTQVESVLAEIDASSGQVLREWSLGDSIALSMKAGGDDPSLFVRDGVDWFHLNSAYYDEVDDSIVVSSRENFVAKIDYQTGALRWIFGDPSKYWATFPSLASQSLSLAEGGLWPIGQHAVTMTADGLLLLFDDGTPSLNQPAGAPAGAALNESSVVAYSIDENARRAVQAWRFDHEPALYSAFCSSAYQTADGSLLVDYADVSGNQTVLVGLDARMKTAFELTLPTAGCGTAWNAEPIPFASQSFE